MSTDTKTEVGSVFISNYPPFSQWNEAALPVVERVLLHSPPLLHKNPLTKSSEASPLGLYLHIPFCRKRASFVTFVCIPKRTRTRSRITSAACPEIELVSRLPVMGERPFRFVYFGGGTPSF